MNFTNTSLVQVYYLGNQENYLSEDLPLKIVKSILNMTQILKTGLELSPLKLPLKSTVSTSGDYLFEGLFGLFNDSLPDG